MPVLNYFYHIHIKGKFTHATILVYGGKEKEKEIERERENWVGICVKGFHFEMPEIFQLRLISRVDNKEWRQNL